MDAARARLCEDIDRLVLLLDLLDAVEEITKDYEADGFVGTPEDALGRVERLAKLSNPAQLHRLVYAVVIALAYAALERYIRDSIEAAARLLADSVPTYAQLPESVREHHARLTAKVAAGRLERDASDLPVTLLTTLLGCLAGSGRPFSLNAEVFSDKSANFRTELIRQTYRRVDVYLPEDVKSPEIVALLEGPLNGLYAKSATLVDDLANRRNDVAHGDDFDVLDRSTLRAILAFLVAYVNGLSRGVFVNQARVLSGACGTLIGTVEHVWTHKVTGERSVARVFPTGGAVAVGDNVLLGGASWRAAQVVAIEKQHQPVEQCGPSDDAHGLDLGVVVHRGERIVVVSDDVMQRLFDLIV